MLIYTIWVNTNDSFDEAWVLNAWDEFSRDENYEGWSKAIEDAKKQYEEVRVIPIRVEIEKLKHAFEVQPIDGQVTSA